MDNNSEGISKSFQELINDAFGMYNSGQHFEAKSRFTQLLNYVPGDPQCLFALALMAYNESKFDEAYRYVTESLKSDNNPSAIDAYMLQGVLLQMQQQLDKSLNSYQKALTLKPDFPDCMNKIATIYNMQGKYEEAIEYFCKALLLKPNDPETIFNMAVAYHKRGNIAHAITNYEKVISIKPNHPKCLNNLGVINLNKRDYTKALEYFSKAVDLSPNYIESLNFLLIVYKHLGQWDNALKYGIKVLNLSPQHHQCLENMASIFQKKGMIKKAIVHFRRAMAIAPDIAKYPYQLAKLYYNQGKYQKAIKFYQQALSIQPGFYRCLYDLGMVHYQLEQYPKALAYFRKALKIKPNYVECLNQLGNYYHVSENLELAREYYEKAIHIKEDFVEGLNNLGVVYQKLELMDKAQSCYEKAISINPKMAGCLNHLGVLYLDLYKPDKALVYLEQAIAVKPEFADCLNSIGLAYQEKGEYDKAREYHLKALAQKPDDPLFIFNKAYTDLLLGQFESGWEGYEARLIKEDFGTYQQFVALLKDSIKWNGKDDIKGKSILIIHEQGMGDYIQFIRFASLLKKLGATVVAQCRKALVPLIKDLEWIDEMYAPERTYDYYVPIMSLAHYFNIDANTIPLSSGYIKPPKSDVKPFKNILNTTKLKVGIVWEGNPKFLHDKKRSIPLIKWIPLLSQKDIQFYCLQVGEKDEETKEVLNKYGVIDKTAELTDFSLTALLISELDLVISVDTSVAHLAGALNQPCWVLLPKNPDWRWLLERTDSPWYQSVKLLRQDRRGSWKSPFDKAIKLLKEAKLT